MEKINVLLPELEFNVTNRSVVVGKIYHTKCCTLSVVHWKSGAITQRVTIPQRAQSQVVQ